MNAGFSIRTMEPGEMDFAINLAAQEGWNPGLQDAEAFFATDPEGFFIATLDDTPIGCISAINYGDIFGFIGFYIVVPAHRGKGYGMQLWNTAINYLKHTNIGLDGVEDQQANYAKSGFVLAHRNIRFCFINQIRPVDRRNLISLEQCSIEEINCYDGLCFPASRTVFLRRWFSHAITHGFAIKRGGKIRGYGCIRACRQGYKIGPLFADTPAEARALFFALCNKVPVGSEIFLDVPQVNLPAMDFTAELAMKAIFSTARMYTQMPPAIHLHKVFGVTTFELG